MYLTPVSLEPALPPRAYCDPAHAELEKTHVFHDAWHLVAGKQNLAKPGQFVTLTLFGIPLVVRNFDGQLVALRNVCAHRQAIIARKSHGCSPTLRCPYHGWEYGADGKTRKLPGASNFPKFKHQQYCLDQFLVEECGDLVFVRFSPTGPTLREWMGENFDLYARWFSSSDHFQSASLRFEIDANWKIPVEGSLESYHIPSVHPQTFYEDPGDKRSRHTVSPTGTTFQTDLLTPRRVDRMLQSLERMVLKVAGGQPSGLYDHQHVFPHLMISRTDVVSVAQVVYPVDAGQCFTLAILYGLEPQRRSWWRKAVTRGMGKLTVALTKTILAEDRDVFPLVQAGTEGSCKTGILGRCEERLFAIQKHIADRIARGENARSVEPANVSADQDGSDEKVLPADPDAVTLSTGDEAGNVAS